MSGLRVAAAALAGLLALVLAWVLVLSPPRTLPAAWVLAIAAGPLLAIGAAWIAGWRQAPFWAGVLALAYFSHGVMEAWAAPQVRVPALVEVALSLAVVLGVGMDGLARRRAARRAASGDGGGL